MTIITKSKPAGVHTPTGYSHAVLIEGAQRRLLVSGQVGMAPDGSVPAGGEAQIEQAYANLQAVLAAHGMGFANIVKTGVFLTDRALLAPFRAVRTRLYQGHEPASTLLFVAGLVDPRLVFEIEAEAVA